jgi:hypothetical protein
VIGTLALITTLSLGAPDQVTVTGAAGDIRVPVRVDPLGAPVIPAGQLLAAIDGSLRMSDGWADVTVARQPFRFLVGAPLYVFSSQLQPLASPVWLSRDTLYLPFQFI